jgi:tetratricopeptide (TPR) repeat protein
MKNYLFLFVTFLAPFLSYSQTAAECFAKGVAKFKLKDYSNAIEYFSKALKDSSNFSEAYNYRGLTKIYTEDFKGAIKDCSKAITINSQFAEAFNNRAIAKIRQNDLNAALDDVNMSLEINPYDAESYLTRMLIRYKQGNGKGAAKDAEINDRLTKDSSIYNTKVAIQNENQIKSKEKNIFIEAKILDYPYFFKEFITDYPNSVYLEECKQLLQQLNDSYKQKVESNITKLEKGMTFEEVKKIIPFDFEYWQGSYTNTSTKDGKTTTTKTSSYRPNEFCSLMFINDKLDSWSKQ